MNKIVVVQQEDDFECRSAEYEIETKICILSREDRRTQPEAFRKTVGIDYIENQCVKSKLISNTKYVTLSKVKTVSCYCFQLLNLITILIPLAKAYHKQTTGFCYYFWSGKK